MAPKTQYADKGGTSIAYQVMGEGPVDLVLSNGIVAHIDLLWAEPQAAAMLRQLASFSRLILFDKPGTGLSDPVIGAPSPEQRMEDIRAVMDAAGSESAAVVGYSEGGLAAAFFAAAYPQRTKALVLLSTLAKATRAPDYLADVPAHDRIMGELERACQQWGEGELVYVAAPSWRDSPAHRRIAPIAERASASPGMLRTLVDAAREWDIRHVLPSVQAPTLIIHRRDEWVPIEAARDLAARIEGARLVELPGDDHIFFAGDWKPIAVEIEAFLTGERHEPATDRLLQTVLFTDIAGSTDLAAKLGDVRWREVLAAHDEIVATEVERFGGRLVKNLGDGCMAAFAGPARGVRCAQAIIDEVAELELQVRAGLHAGECEAIGEDLGGLAVHIAARVAAAAGPAEVLVSSTVRELVFGSGIEFVDRGEHRLKGVPEKWHLYGAAADGRRDARGIEERPGPAAATTMRPIDRASVAMSRHAPGLARFGMRLGSRRR